MSNPYEEKAREEKARKIARVVLRSTIKILAGFGEDEWRSTAVVAGCSTVPSEATRRRVVEILGEIAI